MPQTEIIFFVNSLFNLLIRWMDKRIRRETETERATKKIPNVRLHLSEWNGRRTALGQTSLENNGNNDSDGALFEEFSAF